MLLSAIRAVQNIQLVCFAVVFGCMVAQNRQDRGLVLLFCNYLTGAAGALASLPALHLPAGVLTILGIEVAQIRYAFLHLTVAYFTGLGKRTRWIGMWMALSCLPFYCMRGGGGKAMPEYMLLAVALAIQTAWTAWLLLRSDETMTRWPRVVMGLFLLLYSAIETARFQVMAATWRDPAESAPWLEHLSIYLFVVASSLTPLAFVWMFHSRLLGELKRQNVIDPLTGVLNRRGFEDGWAAVCDSYRLTSRNFALAVADIDHFKQINDTFGHTEGDTVLCAVAEVLRIMVRKDDLAGRLGGEEFVFVLRDVTEAQAAVLVERIRAALAAYDFRLGEGVVHVTASFGVTFAGGRPTPSFTAMLKEADAAMYEAKGAGRNQVRLYGVAKQDNSGSMQGKGGERAALGMLPATVEIR